jgi:molybdopterin synthase sulfur carrier subunit
MITINVSGFLTEFTNQSRQIVLDGSPATVGEAFNMLWQLHLGLRDRVLTEQGQIRLHVNIFLNTESIRRQKGLDSLLKDGDEITILPSVSGGSRSPS